MKLGQTFVKCFVCCLGNGVSRKNTFDIYCPLVVNNIQSSKAKLHILKDNIFCKPVGLDIEV